MLQQPFAEIPEVAAAAKAIAAEGAAKLMLAGMITDAKVSCRLECCVFHDLTADR